LPTLTKTSHPIGWLVFLLRKIKASACFFAHLKYLCIPSWQRNHTSAPIFATKPITASLLQKTKIRDIITKNTLPEGNYGDFQV